MDFECNVAFIFVRKQALLIDGRLMPEIRTTTTINSPFPSGMLKQVMDAWQYWKVKTKDFVVWTVTFVATMVFDIPIGMRICLHIGFDVHFDVM